jgi:hypothetical protein
MPDPHPPLPADTLFRFGLRKATAEAAAQDIAELVDGIFGPFDPEVAEGWALSQAQDLGPAKLRQVLAEAVLAEDPLTFLAPHREALTVLRQAMRVRWSGRQARALGHPEDLRGQTWAFSEGAQAEVRDALRQLSAFADTRVLRHRSPREDLDTFLRELAEIFVIHTGPEGDRRVRAGRPLWHRTDVPHTPTSRFIQLAELVLAQLPPLPSGEARVHPNLRTTRGLSERWKRIKLHEATGRDGLDDPDEDGLLA